MQQMATARVSSRPMLDLRIQQHFIDSADLHYQLAEGLAKPVDAAVQALLACVTGGGKVFTLGLGTDAMQANYLATLLVGGFERERPGLPALSLAGQSRPLQAIQALGHTGDVLFVLSTTLPGEELLTAVAAAHERDMAVLALTGTASAEWSGLLHETDVHMAVPHDRVARVREVQHLVLHCLCDAIDTQLLGEQEP